MTVWYRRLVWFATGLALFAHGRAFAKLACPKELRVVPGATHLFEEPGALEEVAAMASEWFERHFKMA